MSKEDKKEGDKEESVEESDLEEEILDEEELLEEQRFQEFFQPINTSPTLGKRQEFHDPISLEVVANEAPAPDLSHSDDNLSYMSSPEEKTETQYMQAESTPSNVVNDISQLESIGKEHVMNVNAPVSSETKMYETHSPETYVAGKQFDPTQKHDSSKPQEVKYIPSGK